MAEKSRDKAADAFAAHEREQILAKARETTPEQRLLWVEEAFRLFSPQIEQAQRREPKKYF
jgi:hypothetical protein